jgi:hypothetical protein
MVLKCFPDNDLLLVNPGLVNVGLQSLDYQVRLPYLLGLKALLRDWDGLKPTSLVLLDFPSHNFTELEVQQLEDSITQFYTQLLITSLVVLQWFQLNCHCKFL